MTEHPAPPRRSPVILAAVAVAVAGLAACATPEEATDTSAAPTPSTSPTQTRIANASTGPDPDQGSTTAPTLTSTATSSPPSSPPPSPPGPSVDPNDVTSATAPTAPTATTAPLIDTLGCDLLEGNDPALYEQVLSGIDPDVEHGPLMVIEGEDWTVVGTTIIPEPGVVGASATWSWDGATVVAINEPAVLVSDHDAGVVDAAGTDELARLQAAVEDCAPYFLVTPDEPPPPEPTIRPDLMVVQPTTAEPGQEVALSFPTEAMRGVTFQLDRATDGGWETTHWMTSDHNDSGQTTRPADGGGAGGISVGITGPGPDLVLLPDDLGPGAYRICTTNNGEDFCARLGIAD